MRPDTFHQIYKSIVDGKTPSLSFQAAGSLSESEALALYQGGYQGRLTDSLMEKYESVARFLGDENFIPACEAYIQSRPSLDGNINNYGEDFAAFIESSENLNPWPFLADLARLDLLRFRLFHQEDPQGLAPEVLVSQISHWTEDDFIFELSPACAVLESSFPIYDFWQSIYHAQEWPSSQKSGAQSLLLWKHDGQVYFKPVSPTLAVSLQKIRWGTPVLASMALLQENEVSELFQFLGETNLVQLVKSLGK